MKPASPNSSTNDAVAGFVAQWAAERPDLDPSPLLVIGRINRLGALLEDLLRPPFAGAGLASGDFDLLAALRRSGEPYSLGVTTLARHMLVTNGAATKRIDRLESQGLVTRTVSATDGRGRDIRLTERGVGLVDRLIVDHLANERALLEGLPASDQALLADLLGKFLQVIEGPQSTSPPPGGRT